MRVVRSTFCTCTVLHLATNDSLYDRTHANVVLDLMMEVEALREAATMGSTYRDAYRDTGLLTHNNSGPSDGLDKLLDCFYPPDETSEGYRWRETLMMRRLNFTPAETLRYQEKAQEMEAYT